MTILELASCLLTATLAPFFGFLGLIVVAGPVRPEVRPGRRRTGGRSRFLVVIPAHDEEGVIGSTVRSCLALDYPPDRFSVWVIADNCTDATARRGPRGRGLGRRAARPGPPEQGPRPRIFLHPGPRGAPRRRLRRGRPDRRRHLRSTPACSRPSTPGLARGMDWIQGYYTVRNPDASWRTRLMTYAFSLANGVWMLGPGAARAWASA